MSIKGQIVAKKFCAAVKIAAKQSTTGCLDDDSIARSLCRNTPPSDGVAQSLYSNTTSGNGRFGFKNSALVKLPPTLGRINLRIRGFADQQINAIATPTTLAEGVISIAESVAGH